MKILLSMLLCCVFVFAQAQQTVELVSSTPLSIKVGNAPSTVDLKVTNGGAATTVNFTISMTTAPGIYILPGTSLPSGVTQTPSPNRSSLSCAVSIGANTSITFPVQVQAGYCYAFPTNVPTLYPNNIFSVSGDIASLTGPNLNLSVSSSAALSFDTDGKRIYRNSNLVATGNLSIQVDVSDVVVREYIFVASPTEVYNGVLTVDGPDMITPLALSDFEVYYYNPSAPYNFSNPGTLVTGSTINPTTWSMEVPIHVPAGYHLIVREKIDVVGCLAGTNTPLTISTGVGVWETCGLAVATPSSTLSPIEGINLQVVESQSDYRPELTCLSNSNGADHKKIVLKNVGQVTAFNYEMLFDQMSMQAYAVPKSSMKVSIERANGTLESNLTIVWNTANNMLFPTKGWQDDLSWNDVMTLEPSLNTPTTIAFLERTIFTQAGHIGTVKVHAIRYLFSGRSAHEDYGYNAYRYNFFIPYQDHKNIWGETYSSTCLPNGSNTELVISACINRYQNSTGDILPITLAPGDKLIVEWDQYVCCYNSYYKMNAYAPWLYSRANEACPIKTYYGRFLTSPYGYLESGFYLYPGNSNLSQDQDRCNKTEDGQIETISFKIAENLGLNGPINTAEGKLTFKIYMDEGLDLDMSFDQPHQVLGRPGKRGFDNLDGTEYCNSSCGAKTTNVVCDENQVLSAPTYNIFITKPDGTSTISLNARVEKFATYNPANPSNSYLLKYKRGGTTERQAMYVYKVEIDFAELGIVVPTGADAGIFITNYLKQCKLTFDIRCYCPDPNNEKKGVHVLAQYFRCGTIDVDADDNLCSQAPFFSNAWTTGWVDYLYQINCPGCKIPGSNVIGSTFLRQNTGLYDENRNGFPDGNGTTAVPDNHAVRKMGSEGDIMKASCSVYMSNGVPKSTGAGFLKSDLDNNTPPFYLDNLIVRIKVTGSTTTYRPGTAQAKYNGGTWQDIQASDTWMSGGYAYFRIPASLVGSKTSLSSTTEVDCYNPSEMVHFQAEFVLTDVPGNNDNYEVIFKAGYTPCDNCTSFEEISPALGSDMTFASVVTHPNMLLTCTDDGTMYKNIYFRNEYLMQCYDHAAGDQATDYSQCTKSYALRNWGEFGMANNAGHYNLYEQECRYFIPENVPVKYEWIIPAGYTIEKVNLANTAAQSDFGIFENYTVDEAHIADYYNLPAGTTGFYTYTSGGDTYFGINLYYQRETEDADLLDYNYTPMWGYQATRVLTGSTIPARIYVKDEYWKTDVTIYVKPSTACLSSTTIPGFTNQYRRTNLPTGLYSGTPPTNPLKNASPTSLSSISSTPTLVPNSTDGLRNFTGINANLKLISGTDQHLYVDNGMLNIQFNIKNLTSNYQADYPFLILEGPALDPSKGLSFVGVFRTDNVELENYPVYYDLANNRILVAINRPEFTNYNTAPHYYINESEECTLVLRFAYSCSALNNFGCSGGTGTLEGLDNDGISIKPGYGCSYYPTMAQFDDAQYCGLFDAINHTISSKPYGFETKATIISTGNTYADPESFPVNICEQFTYTLNLRSCQTGKITGYNVNLSTLPAGIDLVSYTLSEAGYTVTPDPNNADIYQIRTTNPALYSYLNNNMINLNLTFKTSCEFDGGNIIIPVEGISDCGGILNYTPAHGQQVTINPGLTVDIFSNVNVQCGTNDEITVTYDLASLNNNNYVEIATNDLLIQSVVDETSSPVTVSTASPGVYHIDFTQTGTGKSFKIKFIKTAANCAGGTFPVQVKLAKEFTVTCTPDGCTKTDKTLLSTCNITMPVSSVEIDLPSLCVYNNQVITPVTAGISSTATYQWYKNGAAITPGGDQLAYAVTGNGTYHVVVTDGPCSYTSNSVALSIRPTVSIGLTSANQASLLCANGSVLLHATAYPSTASYDWQWSYNATAANNFSNIAGNMPDDFEYNVTSGAAGFYQIEIEDQVTHCTATHYRQVINDIDPDCPEDPVCPGQPFIVTFPDDYGIAGQYSVQWQNAATMEYLDYMPVTDGYYYATYVTPACTLQAVTACHLTFLPKPPAYIISADGTLNLLPGEDVDLSITGMDAANGVSVTGAFWSTGAVVDINNPGTPAITVEHAGPYYVTSIGDNGCENQSNVLVVNKPYVVIANSGGCGEFLVATSNVPNATYEWYYDDGQGGAPVQITNYVPGYGTSAVYIVGNGVYTAINTAITGAVISDTYYGTIYTAPSNPGINVLTAAESSFSGIDLCTNSGTTFTSDYNCIDITPGSDPNTVTNYNYNDLPGHYIIVPERTTDPTRGYSGYWNRQLWDNNVGPVRPQSTSDYNYMLLDGHESTSSELVWAKDVTVNHNTTYSFTAAISDIDLNSLLPNAKMKEQPSFELRITGAGFSDVLDAEVIFSGSSYINLGGVWRADLPSHGTGESVNISIVIRGGGILGRDVAIDDIVFAPIDICPSPASMLIPDNRPCNATAAVDMKDKFTCSGVGVTFEIPSDLYDNTLQYEWCSMNGKMINTNSPLDTDNNRFFTTSTAGRYALRVKDVAHNCIAIDYVNVNIVTPSVTIVSDGTDACAGVTFNTVGYSGVAGAQYKWYVNNVVATTNSSGIFTIPAGSGASAVKCELVSGCSGAAVFSNIINTSGAQVNVNAGSDVGICSGSNTTLGASAAVTYSWSPASGLSATNVANPTANPMATTTYTVTGTDANGCITTDQVVVTVNALPAVNAGADITKCIDGTTSQLNASGATTYSWSPSTGLSATNVANPTLSVGSHSRTYTVTGIDINGCSNTDQVLVYIITSPDAYAGSDASICSGSSTTLSASSAPVTSYSWSPATGLSSTTVYNPVASPATTTTYTFTVMANITAPGGAVFTCYASDQVVVTVNPLPTVNAGADVIRCYNGTTSQLNATGAATYSWSPTSGLSAANIANPTVGPGPTLSTTYTVTGTSAQGCTNTDQIIVHLLSPPAVSAGSDKITCVGGTGVTLNASSPTGNYSWSPSTGLSATNIYNPVANPSVTTTYTLTSTGTTTSNGVPVTCVVTDQVVVTVNTTIPTVNAGADVSICSGSSTNLLASGATTYSWSPSSGLSATNIANPVANPSSTTTYTVTGTTNGCSNTDQVIVTIKLLPSVSAGSDKAICTGSVVINGSGAVSYSWSPSTGLSSTVAASPTASPTVTTTYTLTGTGSNGCTATDQVVVGVVPVPGILFNGNNLTANLGTLPSGVSISTSPINYKWEYSSSSGGSYTTKSSCTGSSTCTKALLQNYWKLTMIYDMPGGSTCTVTSAPDNSKVSFADNTAGIIVYPVPAHDELYVEYHSDTTLISMVMYDALGKEVLKKQIDANTTVINTHDIPAGVYVVNFIDARNVLHTRRVEIIH